MANDGKRERVPVWGLVSAGAAGFCRNIEELLDFYREIGAERAELIAVAPNSARLTGDSHASALFDTVDFASRPTEYTHDLLGKVNDKKVMVTFGAYDFGYTGDNPTDLSMLNHQLQLIAMGKAMKTNVGVFWGRNLDLNDDANLPEIAVRYATLSLFAKDTEFNENAIKLFVEGCHMVGMGAREGRPNPANHNFTSSYSGRQFVNHVVVDLGGDRYLFIPDKSHWLNAGANSLYQLRLSLGQIDGMPAEELAPFIHSKIVAPTAAEWLRIEASGGFGLNAIVVAKDGPVHRYYASKGLGGLVTTNHWAQLPFANALPGARVYVYDSTNDLLTPTDMIGDTELTRLELELLASNGKRPDVVTETETDRKSCAADRAKRAIATCNMKALAAARELATGEIVETRNVIVPMLKQPAGYTSFSQYEPLNAPGTVVAAPDYRKLEERYGTREKVEKLLGMAIPSPFKK